MSKTSADLVAAAYGSLRSVLGCAYYINEQMFCQVAISVMKTKVTSPVPKDREYVVGG